MPTEPRPLPLADVSRRDFVAATTLSAISALLCGCGGALEFTAPVDPTAVGSTSFRLSDYPALSTVGGIARLNGTSVPVAAVRTSSTAMAAFSLTCPHAGTQVEIVGGGFRCPNHGATFAADGRWTGGQNTSNLTAIPVTFDVAGGSFTLALAAAAHRAVST